MPRSRPIGERPARNQYMVVPSNEEVDWIEKKRAEAFELTGFELTGSQIIVSLIRRAMKQEGVK